MIKVSVFTGTRAEYGLLYWLIKALDDSDVFDLQLIVTGTHLSHEYGFTIKEIIKDGFLPKVQIPCLISSDTSSAITKSMALMTVSLSEYFERESPDCFVVLGDRFEVLAASQTAMIAKIPIVHIHGGEITEGAVDEKIRHAVTKLSNLHFVSTASYRKRVVQMGVQPDKAIVSGALGIESIHRYDFLSVPSIEEELGVTIGENFFLVVYHPETNKNCENISGLLEALSEYADYKKIIIYPNADMMSREVVRSISEYKKQKSESVELLKSVSHLCYLSLMKHCSVLVGNSSSGIIEAPSLKVPVVNVGKRQQGRIRSELIVDVGSGREDISTGIRRALSPSFKKELQGSVNPYDSGIMASQVIVDELKDIERFSGNYESFFDVEFDI